MGCDIARKRDSDAFSSPTFSTALALIDISHFPEQFFLIAPL
jgi:hypothetical protein